MAEKNRILVGRTVLFVDHILSVIRENNCTNVWMTEDDAGFQFDGADGDALWDWARTGAHDIAATHPVEPSMEPSVEPSDD